MDTILIKHICRIPNRFQAVFLKELNMLQVKIKDRLKFLNHVDYQFPLSPSPNYLTWIYK